jgi:uncharacterized protein (TIGR03790 family)
MARRSLALGLLLAGLACARDGERVLVVVNQDSPVSVAIGARYAELRDVPERNVVRLSLETPDPTLATAAHETISREYYRALVRDPLEAHLRQSGLEDQIEFIVTTKGIPLRIDGTAGRDVEGWLRRATRASLDSELTLLFSGRDGEPGPAPNPFYGADIPFREWREQAGTDTPRYLVARLTGAVSPRDPRDGVPAAVARLLRSATGEPEPGASWLIDGDPSKQGSFAAADRVLLGAASSALIALGADVEHDHEPAFATLGDNGRRLQAYASWGSNDDGAREPPDYGRVGTRLFPGRFAARSVALDFVSTSARSFTHPTEYGQSLVSDLLALGAAGAGGHVYEPTLSTVHRPHLLFERYARGATAAEAYWSSVPTLGWMHTWIGDPLMRLDPAPGTPNGDRDGDAVADAEDNCSRIPNAAQRDTDGDGYGNACDADVNNDGLVTTSWGSIFPLGERGDLEWIALTVRSGVYDENHDLDGDGRVDALDLSLAHLALYQAPGPSGRRPPR